VEKQVQFLTIGLENMMLRGVLQAIMITYKFVRLELIQQKALNLICKSLAYLKGDPFSIKDLDEVREDIHGVLSER
jgi:hypothetical protein